MGTPVVTGAVGDRAELLAQGGGIVVPAGDARHLAEGLLSVLLDPAKARQLKVEALASRDRYYWDQLIQDFARVYDL
jgi:glycosyltransferase involved in cell wall biosynthesis